VRPSQSWTNPSESENVTTLAPIIIAFSAANWATLPEPEIVTTLAAHAVAPRVKHLLGEIDQAIAGGLLRMRLPLQLMPLPVSTPVNSFAQLLVIAVEEADFTAAHADVAGRHVGVGADVAEQLAHERLAEMHHFLVRLALGVEIRAALAAAMGRVVSAFFNTCSKARNFSVPSRTEGWNAVRPCTANRAVHLDPVSAIDLHLSVAVHPGHAKHDGALPVRSAARGMRAFRYFEFFSMKGHTDFETSVTA